MWPASALAHATLLSTTPASGTRVATAPRQLVLTFDQQVRPVSGGTDVVNDAGTSVMAGSPRNAPRNVKQLVIPLKPNLPRGDYTVHWSIVSTDGHLIAGVYAIGVGSGGPPPQAASQSTPLDWPFLSARFVYFAGLLLLVGGVVYRVAVYAPAARAVGGERGRLMSLRERHRANQVLALSAVLVLAGGWIALTRQGSEVAGVTFWEAFDHRGPVASALNATRFGRQFGRGIDVTAVFTILVALAYAAVPYGRRLTALLAVPAAAAGVWALAAPGISGHAGDPGRGTLAIIVDTIHVAAAAVWIGGLLQLLVVTPHATRGLPEPERDAVRADIAGRFSRIAVVSVGALAISGAVRALWELSSVSQIWTTSYGRTLIVKTVLFAVTLMLASRSRLLFRRFSLLRRSIAGELVVLTAVVAAVALLTNLPPGSRPSAASAAAPPPAGGPAVVRARPGATVSVWPGTAGTNAVGVSLPKGATQPTLVLQRQNGGAQPVRLVRAGPHAWLAWVQGVQPGALTAQIASGARTWGATLRIGGPKRAPGVPPMPAQAGAVAAAEAGDLAVAAQREGRRRVRFTVLGADGSAPRMLAILVGGTVATPCRQAVDVCWEAPASPSAGPMPVRVLRPGRPAVSGTLDLPAADAPRASALVRQTATALRRLNSVRIQNVIASDPVHSVATHFTVQAPDRLLIDVLGGIQSRIIGRDRWDLQNGSWIKRSTEPVRVPDPFWAQGAVAAYVRAANARSIDATLAVPEGPTFFRIIVDRRTHLVQRLWMVTAAHFMHERYFDFNSAPPVKPPG
ncbi:MAG TPA: copper resistance protein CopC [Gaiellales bacterium]|nr:copper resistance protein CopC [Gaiellales bacterium]